MNKFNSLAGEWDNFRSTQSLGFLARLSYWDRRPIATTVADADCQHVGSFPCVLATPIARPGFGSGLATLREAAVLTTYEAIKVLRGTIGQLR